MSGPGKDAPLILFHCTGYRYRKTGNVNVGDNAQQEHGLKLLRQHYPHAQVVEIANSVNEETTFPEYHLDHRYVSYLVGQPGGWLSRRLGSLARGVLFMWNARRAARGRAPLFLNPLGRELLGELKQASLVFCAGSGTFFDRYMYSVGFLWSMVIVSARALGVPVVLLGQQVGAFDHAIPRAIARFALRRASYLGVRETVSFDTAKALGVDPARLHFTGDEGWYLPPAAAAEVDPVIAGLGLEGGYLAIQMRFDGNSPFRDVASNFARTCDLLAERTGLPVLLVPFSYADRDDDRATLRELGTMLKCPWQLLDVGPRASLTKGILSRASLAVGVANHFCVFAASVGVPTVGIHGASYMEHKLKGVERLHRHFKALGKDSLGDPSALADVILAHRQDWAGKALARGYAERPEGYLDWVPLGPVAGPVAREPDPAGLAATARA